MLLAFGASLGYLLSVFILYCQNNPSYRITSPAVVAKALPLFMGVSLLLHLFLAATQSLGERSDLSVMNVLSLVSVSMVFIGNIRYFMLRDFSAYAVVALIATICVWLPLIFTGSQTTIVLWELKLHVVLSISAYIALAYAALYAVFLLIKDYRLRRGKTQLNGSPPLCDTESTMLHFTLVGQVLLSLSLVTGIIFIHDLWEQHVAHKVIFSIVSWIIIGALLLRHYHQGFRGQKAAIWLLGGFFSLVLAYFGSSFILHLFI